MQPPEEPDAKRGKASLSPFDLPAKGGTDAASAADQAAAARLREGISSAVGAAAERAVFPAAMAEEVLGILVSCALADSSTYAVALCKSLCLYACGSRADSTSCGSPLVCVPRRDVRVKGLAAATALVDAYGPESGPRSDILGVLEDFLAGGAGSALAASNEARLDHQVARVGPSACACVPLTGVF